MIGPAPFRTIRASALTLARLGAVAVALFAVGYADVGHAGLNVSGTAAALRVVADSDPLGAVISAVAVNCHATYRTAVALDETVSGNYSGSLDAVIAHLLSGYDYLIRHDGTTIDIVVIGRRGARAVAPQPPPTAAAATAASRWR
jgi:hypothetical protein